MLTHKDIWRGIDLLAERNRLSASGLAKRAGLDPTTFNKSKRTTKQGKPRWPSTESLSKILEATSTSMAEFTALLGEGGHGGGFGRRIRCLSLSQMEREEAFDASGFPQAGPWEDIEFPSFGDDGAYAIELDRDIMPPLLRAGDMLVVSPKSSVRRTDRIVLRRRDGQVAFGVLLRRTAQRISLAPLARGEQELAVEAAEVAWLARILWISQ
jgi:phage repressor protein C with HTH and peptisase S24 domain